MILWSLIRKLENQNLAPKVTRLSSAPPFNCMLSASVSFEKFFSENMYYTTRKRPAVLRFFLIMVIHMVYITYGALKTLYSQKPGFVWATQSIAVNILMSEAQVGLTFLLYLSYTTSKPDAYFLNHKYCCKFHIITSYFPQSNG